MWLWIIGLIISFFIIKAMWKVYTHPAHSLGRQAANMNWVVSGNISDETYKNVCVKRDCYTAMISYRNLDVVLLQEPELRFKNFIELEHWIATNRKENL